MSARGPGRGRRAPPSASSRPSAAAASALRAPPARGQRAKPRRRRGPGGRGGPGGRSPGGRARPSDGRRRRSRDPRPGGSPRRGRRPGTPLPPPPPPRPRRWAGQGFLARPAPSGPRLDTPPAAPLGGRRRLLLAPAARVIFREVRAPASWGRAARGRGLGSPRARRGAPSAQGLAPPPPPPLRGPRETLGSPASPVLRHGAPRGRRAQVRAPRSPIASAAVRAAPAGLLRSAAPPGRGCIPSGRLAAGAPAAAPHRRAERAFQAPAPPRQSARPARSRQLCSRSVRGAGEGRGAAGCPGPGSRRRVRGPGAASAHRPPRRALGKRRFPSSSSASSSCAFPGRPSRSSGRKRPPGLVALCCNHGER